MCWLFKLFCTYIVYNNIWRHTSTCNTQCANNIFIVAYKHTYLIDGTAGVYNLVTIIGNRYSTRSEFKNIWIKYAINFLLYFISMNWVDTHYCTVIGSIDFFSLKYTKYFEDFQKSKFLIHLKILKKSTYMVYIWKINDIIRILLKSMFKCF